MAPANKNDDACPIPSVHNQIITSITEVTQATIRLEEKLTTLFNTHTSLAQRFEKLLDNYNALLERVINIEAQDVESIHDNLTDIARDVDSFERTIQEIERRLNSLSRYKDESEKKFRDLEIQGVHMGVFKQSTETKFSTILQFSLQIIMGLLLAYISYRLSIPVQNTPDFR
jgi:chromosome segregation ATPase